MGGSHPEHLQLVQEDKVQDQAYRSSSQQQGKRLKKDSVVDVFIIFTASISSLLDVFPRNLLYKDRLIEWQNVFGSLAKFCTNFCLFYGIISHSSTNTLLIRILVFIVFCSCR